MPNPFALPEGMALFTFHGRVVRGKRLGSRLGFPTANIAYDPQSRTWPREGVYVGVAQLDGESRGYVCIINQGRHPTVPEGIATVEAHLLGHAHRDLYGLYPMQIENVCYQYDEDDVAAVDHVSLNVEKGSFVAVLGHNGSGKSTLAKLMNALYLPTEGRVLVCGLDTAQDEEVWHVRRHAGMVFQNPDNQIVANVVREDVAFGLENLGVPHEDMILDEATAMLDPAGRADVLATVRKLNREQGMTVIWITHFMEEAAVADRVVVLDKGKIALDGTPAEVFSQVQKVKALGLDVPPMAELAMRLRAGGLSLPDGILTVADMVKELKKALCPSK